MVWCFYLSYANWRGTLRFASVPRLPLFVLFLIYENTIDL